ncbi:hypothetical protein LTR84_000617 [Exophiala bonariae]|uniref:Alpha-N-arabinofuranosidase n=1 Tax=Exophiala bonariae TaxID=1690606 RepID=A0AAV9NRE8_9EURO|nr:hypothetical protein LTR84_000617 [Exophiala bonariae]
MSNRVICDVDMPDPWMVAAQGRFYLTFTLGNRVEIWASQELENFRNCEKIVAWKPASGTTEWSVDIWAPELHYLGGRWYVYFCAAHGGIGNRSHRTTILRSESQNPMDADAWTFVGPMKGLPDHWNIDATVFTLNSNELYCCYSGWPLGDSSDTQQDLFLIQLANPEQAIPNTLTCISRASLPWERPDGGRRGVNEGPTWLSIPGFQGIVYSANGSWTCDYKLAVLRYNGGNPRDERSWVKRPTPLLESDPSGPGPFGPGHASFLVSPYPGDARVFCIYHATGRPDEGWNNRKARVLCMGLEHFQPHGQTIRFTAATGPVTSTAGPYPGQQYGNGGPYAPPIHNQQRRSLVDKLGDKVSKMLGGR